VRAPCQYAVGFLRNEPDVLIDFFEQLYSRMNGLLRKISQLMSGNASPRLLNELVISFERFGKRTDDRCFIPAKSVDVAKDTGLTRDKISPQPNSFKYLYDIKH
jgi:hypothetical protein